LVGGKLLLMPAAGGVPGRAAGRIYRSLDDYERAVGGGYAFPDNVGFLVDLSDRQSFSPDAAFWVGELPASGEFLPGAPVFAVEVRSGNGYDPNVERELARKRADYFAAGTLVVWDVDVLRAREIRAYCADRPDEPEVFRQGDRANAEPALPGWSLLVDEVLERGPQGH
jgi:Uma2 family endonuclease